MLIDFRRILIESVEFSRMLIEPVKAAFRLVHTFDPL